MYTDVKQATRFISDTQVQIMLTQYLCNKEIDIFILEVCWLTCGTVPDVAFTIFSFHKIFLRRNALLVGSLLSGKLAGRMMNRRDVSNGVIT